MVAALPLARESTNESTAPLGLKDVMSSGV
jgi:hypothetical protein